MLPAMFAVPVLFWWLLAAPAPAKPLDIQADRLELDESGRTLLFTGHVEAKQGKLTLKCGRLEAKYGPEPKRALLSLSATGGVKLVGDGITASSKTARYDHRTATLVLEGAPTASRAGHTLRGDKITLWPDAGRVVVERPRGRLSAPALDGVYRTP